MQSSYNTHVKRIVVILLVGAVLGLFAQKILRPEGFGKYGHYRAGAVSDEMNREVRHLTNQSCLACHPSIREMHLAGVHKTVSCEFCHGPFADHIQNGVKTGELPVKKGAAIKTLCLRCHNQIIRARPKESIKMISMPQHLEQKRVNVDHICDQCHNVHSPMLYVERARTMITGIEEGR